MADESYPLSDAANVLGVSVPTLRRMVTQKRINAFRTPGGHLRITAESLSRYQSGTNTAPTREPSSVLRNRRERVEELALEAQVLRARREVGKLRQEQEEERAQAEAEVEAQEHQAERETEAARLRLERVKIQQGRERERREAERELQAFRTRWLQEAEKFLDQFRFRLDHPWLSQAQRREILNVCEVEIANRQLTDEPLMTTVIERTVSATIEPWECKQRIEEARANVSRAALWKLPSGATDLEKARALNLIRQALEKLPANAAEFELRAAAEESIEALCHAIERRELAKEVSNWAVRQLPWEATDADKNSLRRDCLEALAQLPEDVSEAEAREQLQELVDEVCREIDARQVRAERKQRKSQLIAQGVREVLSYLLDLKRDGEISSDEVWDSDLRRDLEQAVRDELEDQLTGQETTQEVKESVREIIDDELGVESK